MILYKKYICSCQWISEPMVPSFMGSYLRGEIENQLKRASYALRTRSCVNCPLEEGCAYGFIFATSIPPRQGSSQALEFRGNFRPHPFVLEMQFLPEEKRRQGSRFSFSFMLLERANDYFIHVVYALLKTGMKGIGRDTKSGHGRFVIKQITISSNNIVYSTATTTVKKPDSLDQLSFERASGDHVETDSLKYRGNGLYMFLPLLRYIETVRVGKQTSFGFGESSVVNI